MEDPRHCHNAIRQWPTHLLARFNKLLLEQTIYALLICLLTYLRTYLLTDLLTYLLQSCSMLCSIATNGAALSRAHRYFSKSRRSASASACLASFSCWHGPHTHMYSLPLGFQ